MRIGLIADIHGNQVALATVLGELDRVGVDEIICLGDIAVLGPQPQQVIATLRERKIPCVIGNTDVWLLPEPVVVAEPPVAGRQTELVTWCGQQLADDERAFLGSLPMSRQILLDGAETLLCFHASPDSVDDIITATTPVAELDRMLRPQLATVFAGGHTHQSFLRRFHQASVLNPGSVGLPGVGPDHPAVAINEAVTWAECGVIESEQGRIGIEFRRLPLDLDRMAIAVRRSGMPHADWWLSCWGPGQTG